MKNLVILPTYNESENVRSMAGEVLKNEGCDILFVDDNSPDGTGAIIKEMAHKDGRVKLLSRPGKLGLGTAYIEGFRFALENGYESVLMMDSDFSHPLEKIGEMFSSPADVAVGSRYMEGSGIEGWAWHRLFLSKYANVYARTMLCMPVKDLTGGFNRIKTDVLKKINLDMLKEEGYSFQIELKYSLWKKGAVINEIPIVFRERRAGKSKMSKKIIWDAFWLVLRLAFFGKKGL